MSTGFFEEAPGVKSVTRLQTTMGYIGALALMGMQAFAGHLDNSVLITFIGVLSFHGVGNKIAENLGGRSAGPTDPSS
jgi:hypothetical protein